LVPEPIEKCAVCAASPISTTLPVCHLPHRTTGKFRQIDRFLISRCPASSSAKMFSRIATVWSSSAFASPALRHVSSRHSTMNVEPSFW
jgi:hypothetical protein